MLCLRLLPLLTVIPLCPANSIRPIIVEAGSKDAPTVVLIGGLEGKSGSSAAVLEEATRYRQTPASRRRFRVLAVAEANPGSARLQFPPAGRAYRENSESHALWRWIGFQAPDLVVVLNDTYGLAEALSTTAAASVGKIPSSRAESKSGILSGLGEIASSEARTEMNRRVARTPAGVAKELEPFYGHEFPDAVYIPAMALGARIRLGHLADVQRITEPFASGAKDSLAKATGSHLSGHLVFAELAQRTNDKRYVDLVRKAADLGFAPGGEMKESMPFHSEMSDAVFMSCPILAKAGRLTGDRKYFDMTLRHFLFMQNLCRRGDGLYRHSPLHETAWGRGNAFPALGLALALGDMPKQHPGHRELLGAFQSLMARLAEFQDQDGMWHQVVDLPESYQEFSATAMIGRAMLLGVRNGWLERKQYQRRIDAAWRAVSARISADGQVGEVCESTGKQKSLEQYLQREAILGKDPRGGGMAMMFAVEMARLP